MPIARVYYNFTPGRATQSYKVHDFKRNKVYHYTVDVRKRLDIHIKKQRIKQIIQQVSEVDSLDNKTYTESGESLT